MTDPLNDPRFPNRPQHEDFWRLSEIILQLDAEAQATGVIDISDVVQKLVGADLDSIHYMAVQRALFIRGAAGLGTEQMAAGWIDGFLAGVLFQQRRSLPEQRQPGEET